MTIPKNFGISKISVMRGEEDNRYGGREGSKSSSRTQNQQWGAQDGLSFELNSANDAVALLQPPSFNVLYVSTPKIALLQTPQFRAAAQLWEETVELVRPMLRFGFPETSLKTKCPYYNDKLYQTPSGALLAQDRTRTLLAGINNGFITPSASHSNHHSSSSSSSRHEHGRDSEGGQDSSSSSSSAVQQQQQQQQPSARVGMFGISTVAFLASQVMGGIRQQKQQQQEVLVIEQHPEQRHGQHGAIPRGRFLVPDIPSGTLVLALNLGAYWMITNQSRRSSMGGTMTG